MTEENTGSSGFEILLAGIAMGVILTMVAIVLFRTEPWIVDCGCGAASQMCMQCINGGNLSAPVCGAFTGVRI